MYDLTIPGSKLVAPQIDAAMRVEFGAQISGVSYDGQALRVHFYEMYDPVDEVAAQAIVDAHDPVFIQAERSGDTITVTLSKPRNLDAVTELTLTVDATPLPEATTLTDNAATVLIESADEITIGIVEAYPHQEVTI